MMNITPNYLLIFCLSQALINQVDLDNEEEVGEPVDASSEKDDE